MTVPSDYQESPLYTQTYDFLIWLIPLVQKYPRAHRFGLAERIHRLALDFQDALTEAGKSRGRERFACLRRADVLLAQLRIWLRLSSDLQLISLRQYEHAAQQLVEIGRMLGAWIKQFS